MTFNMLKIPTTLLGVSVLAACATPATDTTPTKTTAQKQVAKPVVSPAKPMKPQAKPKPKPQQQTRPQPKPKPKPKPQQQTRPQPKPQPKPQIQAKTLPANATRMQQLQGYDWKLLEFKDEKGAVKRAFDMGGPVQHYVMKIAPGNRVSLKGKCNTLMGVGNITEQGVFTVPKLASSRMGCPSKFRQADAQMSGLMRYAKNYRLQGQKLQVISEGGTMFFQRMPAGQ